MPRSESACIPPGPSQWSTVLSSPSLIPSRSRLYKWGPCSYQGYQFVWSIRSVRVRTTILSSPRLRVTLLLFAHAFRSCAFISFLPQRAEKHRRWAEGRRDERRRFCLRRKWSVWRKEGGNKMWIRRKVQWWRGTDSRCYCFKKT